ncbi:uncharacterized protein LOC116602193 [Nematostella vectensis]|uniref:uncharacterized protein LOC116602193 n=1 Tax=Nematostella vectensis TaxID=45351 RepID=UPI0020779BA2|nr:uncharacterized protein LOC116602193 [Nematostella vectensis]
MKTLVIGLILLVAAERGAGNPSKGTFKNTPDKCAPIMLPEKFVSSKGFPSKNYPLNAHCIYEIPDPRGKGVELEFKNFELEAHDKNQLCGFDYLEIFDDEGDSFGKYCGHDLQDKTIQVEGRKATIVFHSDLSMPKRGFIMKFKPLEEPTTRPSLLSKQSLVSSGPTTQMTTEETTGRTERTTEPPTSEAARPTSREITTAENNEKTTEHATTEGIPTEKDNILTITETKKAEPKIFVKRIMGTEKRTKDVSRPEQDTEESEAPSEIPSLSPPPTAVGYSTDKSVIDMVKATVSTGSQTSLNQTTPPNETSTEILSNETLSTGLPSNQTLPTELSSNETFSTELPLNQTLPNELPSNETLSTVAPSNETISTESPSNETISTESPSNEKISTEAPWYASSTMSPAEPEPTNIPKVIDGMNVWKEGNKESEDRAMARDLRILSWITKVDFLLNQIKAEVTNDMVEQEEEVFAAEAKRTRGIDTFLSDSENMMKYKDIRRSRVRRDLEDDLMAEITRLEAVRARTYAGKTRPNKKRAHQANKPMKWMQMKLLKARLPPE